MIRNRYIYDIPLQEWGEGKVFMLQEVLSLGHTHPITILLLKAITDFESGKFSYDGATFVKERSKSLFEVAAFIHDWRNAMGYVGKKIDKEMFDVMNLLNYPTSLVIWRFAWTRLTFINVWRHKVLRTFLSDNPSDLYVLPSFKYYSENHPNN